LGLASVDSVASKKIMKDDFSKVLTDKDAELFHFFFNNKVGMDIKTGR
jgi:hypothetical protein